MRKNTLNIDVLIRSILAKERIRIVILSLKYITHTLLIMSAPYLLKLFIDLLVSEKPIISELNKLVLTIALANILAMIIGYLLNLLENKLKNDVSYSVMTSTMQLFHDLPLDNLQGFDFDYLSQKLMSDSFVLGNFYINIISTSIVTLIKTTVLISIVFLISPSALVIFALTIPIYILTLLLCKKAYSTKNYNFKENQNNLFAVFNYLVRNMASVKTHSILPTFMCRFHNKYSRYLDSSNDMTRISYLFSNVDVTISLLFNLILMAHASVNISQGNINVGDFLLIIVYFNELVGTLKGITKLYESRQGYIVSKERMNSLYKLNTQKNGTITFSNIHSITLKDISINRGDNTLLNGLSYEFKTGYSYLVKGPNGIGKSTLIKLILGLIDGFDGEILINDINITQLDMKKIRFDNFSVLEQDENIFSGNLKSYFSYFVKHPFNNDMESISKQIGIHSFIESNTLDFDIIDNGVNISGGEKQKLAILRALLKMSNVLILDEPNTYLDVYTKEKLITYLNSIKKKCIVIVISHETDFGLCDEEIDLTLNCAT